MESIRGHENYATAKVSQAGGPICADSRGRRRGRRCDRGRRGHGLEEWCDLSNKKVLIICSKESFLE